MLASRNRRVNKINTIFKSSQYTEEENTGNIAIDVDFFPTSVHLGIRPKSSRPKQWFFSLA